ncbi:S41 family peptidase [Pseudoduganella sp. OTU4001]|uniref:S41 family peptidase n=1 Tax=Pseudoduganella sp. OTU4001 TaxID=3043854 RepID=UPI00313E405D
MSRNTSFLAAGLMLAVCSAAHAGSPWADLAKADLDFVYQTVRADHPGMVDQENPYFRAWAEKGYAQAIAELPNVRSLHDAQVLLRRYFAGFADGHLWLTYSYEKDAVRWAGMMVQRQGQRYVVGHSEESEVPVGAELVSCDGRKVDTLIEEDLLPGAFNNRQLDWLKSDLANNVLAVVDQNVHPEYARCTFAVSGAKRDVQLIWRDLAHYRFDTLARAMVPTYSKDSTITEIKPGTYWVRLPQFQPDDAQVKQLNEIAARMPSLRNAELIIFDTRGNSGGNSTWGRRVLEGLVGGEYLHQQARNEGYAEWRASAGNLAYIRDGILPRLTRQYGAGHKDLAPWESLQRRMQQAIEQGKPFVRQGEAAPAKTVNAATMPVAPLSKARIALVTKSGCSSACLDFADYALALPGTVHLGETTGADTVYMDVRPLALPSGLGRFSMAQKVYRGRPRAHNAAYAPPIPYPGAIQDTAALQTWTMQQLAAKSLTQAGSAHEELKK